MDMSKLLRGIYTATVRGDEGIEDWNEAVRRTFGPLVRRKAILRKYRDLLRTELVNFRKIEKHPEAVRLLRKLLRLYRRSLMRDRKAALEYLISCFPGSGAANENWLSLSLRAEWPPSNAVQDTVHAQFDWMDTILEGCHKYHFRTFYGFARHQHGSAFPTNIEDEDYGALVGGLPKAARSEYRFLCEDPEHGVPVNQWRNVAAHKLFRVRSSRTLDITYGRPPKQVVRRITTASLRRTLEWSTRALGTLRLASTITYLEFMSELHAAGLPAPVLRLDSWLVGLFHNLRLVGFLGVGHTVDKGAFTIDLLDAQQRSARDAIIHASQVLDQMSVAVQSDPSVRPRPKVVRVRLVDMTQSEVASASVDTTDALAFTERRMTMKQYVDRIDFAIGHAPATGGST